jgi:hypothetical protein
MNTGFRIPAWGYRAMSRYQVDKFQRDINHDRALAERWRAESGAVFDPLRSQLR